MFEDFLYALMFQKKKKNWFEGYSKINDGLSSTKCLSESAPHKVIKELLQKANPGANL